MLNVTPQTWIEEGEKLGKEASSVHVSLNMTESEQDRGELGKEVSSMHVSLNVTESEEDREDSGRYLVPEHWKD